MAKPIVRPEFYTYADYYAWPDVIRGELIDGHFHDMTPAPSQRHQRIVVKLSAQLEIFFEDKACAVFVAPFDVRLPKEGDEDGMERDVVQPDIAVICDRAKIDDRGCRGAPDWIIEVLSPRTREKDLTLKRDLYERSGVGLYWMLSPRERTVEVLRLEAGRGYSSAVKREARGRQVVAEYPGLTIDWDRAFRE
jgi:Uma2 family endonuclease